MWEGRGWAQQLQGWRAWSQEPEQWLPCWLYQWALGRWSALLPLGPCCSTPGLCGCYGAGSQRFAGSSWPHKVQHSMTGGRAADEAADRRQTSSAEFQRTLQGCSPTLPGSGHAGQNTTELASAGMLTTSKFAPYLGAVPGAEETSDGKVTVQVAEFWAP